MITPEKIWVWIEQLHGYESLSASDQPRADGFPTVEYTRADLTPPAADYVAGLEAAMRYYADDKNGNDGWTADQSVAIAALAARPASPDTRVVTLSQIADWFDAVANPARAQSPQHMAANYRDRLHAIINGGQDRG